MSTVPEILAEDTLDSAPDVESRPGSTVRDRRPARGRPLTTIAATWPVLLPALVALVICGYQLTRPHALAGVHGYTGYGYDDGVYLGTVLGVF